MSLNREQLLAAIAATIVEVPVDGVGTLRIRQVSENEFSTFSESARQGGSAFLSRLAVAALVDDAGTPLLTEADIPSLQAGAFGPVQSILGAVAQANRVGGGEQKNSPPTPVGDSSTA